MLQHIPIYHRSSRLDRLTRNKDLKHDISYSCDAVRRYLIIDWEGNCFICPCEVWMPVSVGNILDFHSLEDVWNSPVAKMVQQDIDSRKFTWCAVDMCGIRHDHVRFDRYTISINIDPSCNLRCPSCRKDQIMLDHGPDFDIKQQRANHLVELLSRFDHPCHIIMSGNGDVLASHIMRPIIHDFNPKPTQTFRLFTNGLLIKKQLQKSKLLPQISQYQISIDAGSQDVYERVRLGGKWRTLIANFDFLRPIAQQHNAAVWLMLVLQKENWKDIENFAELATKYGWQGNITKLVDWATWEDFDSHDVIGNSNHPDHSAAVNSLRKLMSHNRPNIHLDSALKEAIS